MNPFSELASRVRPEAADTLLAANPQCASYPSESPENQVFVSDCSFKPINLSAFDRSLVTA
jgi:hypothetical protein